MNTQEYTDLLVTMMPRFQAHIALKMGKNVVQSDQPRSPSLDTLIKRLGEEYDELINAINGKTDSKGIQMECADVAVCAFLIFCLMNDRQTKHPEPRYWRQFAQDTGINKEA